MQDALQHAGKRNMAPVVFAGNLAGTGHGVGRRAESLPRGKRGRVRRSEVGGRTSVATLAGRSTDARFRAEKQLIRAGAGVVICWRYSVYFTHTGSPFRFEHDLGNLCGVMNDLLGVEN